MSTRFSRRRSSSPSHFNSAARPVIEGLEGRRMMSVTLDGTFGVTVNGDDGGVVRDDAIVVRRQASNPFNVQILVNGAVQHTRSMSQLGTLNINGRGGNDTVTFDDASGAIALRFGGSIQVDGGTGVNSVVVQGGTAGSASYAAGAFSNTGSLRKSIGNDVQLVNFTNTQKVRELSSAAQFTFTGVSDELETTTVDDGEVSNDGLLRIRNSTTTRSFAAVEFANKTNVTINTDIGAVLNPEGGTFIAGDRDLVTLRNTQSATGLSTLTVNTHRGADSVRVASNVVPVTVNTGSGNDVVTIGTQGAIKGSVGGNVNGIGPAVTVTDTLDQSETLADPAATTGTDSLSIDDSGDTAANEGELTNSFISGLGMVGGVNYSGMESVAVRLGSGSDTLRVRSTRAGVAYTLDGGGGDDFFRLGSAGLAGERGGGTVNNLRGGLTIQGGAGSHDAILVDDSGDTAGNLGVITNTTIGGMGMANVSYAGIEGVKFDFGSGNDALFNQVVGTTPLVLVDLGPGEL
jgi:acrosin